MKFRAVSTSFWYISIFLKNVGIFERAFQSKINNHNASFQSCTQFTHQNFPTYFILFYWKRQFFWKCVFLGQVQTKQSLIIAENNNGCLVNVFCVLLVTCQYCQFWILKVSEKFSIAVDLFRFIKKLIQWILNRKWKWPNILLHSK